MTQAPTRIRSYGCCVCQARHYDGEEMFRDHLHHQSKHGVSYDLPLTTEQATQRDQDIISRLAQDSIEANRLRRENLALKCRVTMLEAAYAMAQKCREAGR